MRMNPAVRISIPVVALILLVALFAPLWLTPWAGTRVRSAASTRRLDATWSQLRVTWPATLHANDFVLRDATGDTVLAARTFEASAEPWSVVMLHPAIATARLDGARIRLGPGNSEDDTLAVMESESEDRPGGPGVAPRVQRAAEQLTRALLVPARRLPALNLSDVHIQRGESTGVDLDALSLTHRAGAVELAVAGKLELEQTVPFDAQLRWANDDRLTGRAELRIPEEGLTEPTPVVFTVDGRVTQDRKAGQLRIGPGTRVTLGEMAMQVQGMTDTHGPRLELAVAMDALTGPGVQRSLPRALLGPLADLSVRGSWDWHASFHVDLAKPDSVRYQADVIPHGLTLDAAGSGLRLGALQGPFLANIHLPHDRIVHRSLSAANPHFRNLNDISESLRFAVVTNEDGGFFWHRGFNTGAIQLAVAANLRAGSYKRGAGTITMQLARNLFLGHRRTLSRKGQEVVLAWVLEHMVGVPKERLLEIYLNIIEWGPGLHGADEAAHFYFDKDAADLTLSESLFMTIVIPSPSKWRWRLDANGALRPYARAQMHFIGRKMQAKGWLGPTELVGADSLAIELRGPARALFAPRDSIMDSTSTLRAQR
ncbi:MAG: transglycosylase domain-containing protein [Candidatus Eisenbacteria bacterium]